jgi:hypothetical protein
VQESYGLGPIQLNDAAEEKYMPKQQPRPRYLSYLLRLWQTKDGKRMVWRASLQSPSSEERHGFASLKELLGFLQTQTEQAEPREGETNEFFD